LTVVWIFQVTLIGLLEVVLAPVSELDRLRWRPEAGPRRKPLRAKPRLAARATV
jgi:hypothetical protein